MVSVWEEQYPELGVLIGLVEKMDFNSPGEVFGSIRALIKAEPLLIAPLTLALEKSPSKQGLVARLPLLAMRSLEENWGCGTRQIFEILLESHDYVIENFRPDDPGVAQLVEDLIILFRSLHDLHEWPRSRYAEEPTRRKLIGELEFLLIERISERTKPIADDLIGTEVTIKMLTPEPVVQEAVLRFLLSFGDFPAGVKGHTDKNDPVRRKTEELAPAFIAGYDEELVIRLHAECERTLNSGIIERGLIRRFQPSEVLKAFLAHRDCNMEEPVSA